jgi:hypothetical protein
MTRALSRRLLRLEQRRQLSQQEPPDPTIVLVSGNSKEVGAVRWSSDEHQWMKVPVPPDEASD